MIGPQGVLDKPMAGMSGRKLAACWRDYTSVKARCEETSPEKRAFSEASFAFKKSVEASGQGTSWSTSGTCGDPSSVNWRKRELKRTLARKRRVDVVGDQEERTGVRLAAKSDRSDPDHPRNGASIFRRRHRNKEREEA